MSKSRLVSGKVKKLVGSELDSDRSSFLNLANAEPDLGLPNVDGSILVADIDGTRYWSPSIRADVTGNIFLGSINSADGSTAIRLTNSTIIEGDLTIDSVANIPTLITSDIRSLDSSSIVIANSIIAQSNLEVQNDLTVNGNFTVLGATTTISSTTLTVEDKNIELAKNSTSAANSDGAGITVIGPATPATIAYDATTDTWNFNKTIVGTVQGATSIQDIDDRIDLFFDNDINTSDSSSIVFVPSVELRSDLTVDNDVRVTNSVYADRFVGDGSQLTNLPTFLGYTGSAGFTGSQGLIGYTGSSGTGGGSGVTSSTTPPVSPSENELWFNTELLNLYIYYNDGNSTQWVQINTAGASGTGIVPAGSNNSASSYNSTVYTATENQTVIDQDYTINKTEVYVNGVKLLNGVDFTATNGTSITLAVGLTEGDKVEVIDNGTSSEPTVDFLIVAGGGSGGGAATTSVGGGGGAAGLIYRVAYPVLLGQAYNIVVGAGGAQTSAAQVDGNPGSNSTAFDLTAIGGGYGSTFGQPGGAGGSGGGGAGRELYTTNNFGGSSVAGQGNDGGNATRGAATTDDSGGGGGGAGSPGENAKDLRGGDGGNGFACDIEGFSTTTYYAGGGGGGTEDGTTGASGGKGGGGDGGYAGGARRDGIVNTGGGGGGASGSSTLSGGAGGSGVVIIRTLLTASSTTGTPTVTQVGLDNIYKFTGSGSITF